MFHSIAKFSMLRDMNKDFYTIDEFAAILRVHPATLRTAIKNGNVRAYRLANNRRSPFRIPIDELERIKASSITQSLNVHFKNNKEV